MEPFQARAIKKGFAVSFVVLSREVPIHKFETVYQNIVKQLQGNFEGTGIRNMLEAWLSKLALTILEGQKDDARNKKLEQAETFRNIPGMDINFANALTALVNNRFAPMEGEDKETRIADHEILIHWFEGGRVTRRELKSFQIY